MAPTLPCDVCDIILQVASADFDEWAEEILGEVSAVLSPQDNCPHAQSLTRAASFRKPLAEYAGRLLAVKKEDQTTSLRLGLVVDETPDGVLLYDHVSATTSRSGMVPDQEWIDIDVIRGWMATCVGSHGTQCEEPVWLKGVGRSNPEWLIDVMDGCIVSLPVMQQDKTKTTYITLSYTWGLGRNLKTTKTSLEAFQQPGALRSAPFSSQLPETIRNAMDLVAILGERYLWVDALCIVQDDPVSLSTNLNKMHLIYAGAAFCIVAATGQGADYGLRGLRHISQPRRIDMRVYDLAGGERLVAKPLDDQQPGAVTKFSYHQRGWTFQEWLFSRRRLAFKHDLLEWQCQCASWREDMLPRAEVDDKWRLRFRRQTESLTPSPSIWDFSQLVSDFNRKALTLPADAPRAFAGIQAMLHRVHPGGLIYGLSEFFFEVQLAWASPASDINRRIVIGGTLPSWSWLGWEGDVAFAYDSEFRMTQPWHGHEQKMGFLAPVTKWYALSSLQSQTAREIRSEWYEYKKRVSGPVNLESDSPCLGWSREPYNPELYPYDFCPAGREQSSIFSHELKPEEPYKYPVPVLKWSEDPVLSEQAPFLRCTTSRVRLLLTNEAITSDHMYNRRIRIADSNQDQILLSLTLPNMSHVERFLDASTRPKSLELIASAQGWSTWLGESQKDAQNCYLVLLVETINGVSYRLGCGEARESWWHQSDKEEAVDIIMG